MCKMINVLFSLLLLLFFGCSCKDPSARSTAFNEWMKPNGKLKVLSTIAMIGDLVKQVGGDKVDSLTLIVGELDPHSYQLVKGDDEKLAFADLIFYNGLGLEHGPSLQSFLSRESKATALGDKIYAADSSSILKYRGVLDPHIWMDVSLWAKAVPYIVQTLSQKDPVNAELYRANGDKLVADMLLVHGAVRSQLQQIPDSKRYLVTSHDAFNYFTRAYLAKDGESQELWQERFAAPEGLAPESQLSTSDIQEIIKHLQKYQIRVLFPESNVSKDSIRKIVQAVNEKGMDVKISVAYLYADAMGRTGSDGDTYLKMIQHNASILASYLQNNGNG